MMLSKVIELTRRLHGIREQFMLEPEDDGCSSAKYSFTVSLIARSSLISNCLSGINMTTCAIGD